MCLKGLVTAAFLSCFVQKSGRGTLVPSLHRESTDSLIEALVKQAVCVKKLIISAFGSSELLRLRSVSAI